MTNKALFKDLFRMIIKFIFWNIIAFAIPTAFIWWALSDAIGGTAIIGIFLLPLFLPSLRLGSE